MLHQATLDISFGDCDPAGIVFFPNYFRWMDAVFHGFLKTRARGHAQLCQTLGAKGLGLMETSMSFASPTTDGDRLTWSLDHITWQDRSFELSYRVETAARKVLEGRERRGVFVMTDGRMRTADANPLRGLLTS
jgi:4-hydroxybenzoyl-CoA thioesterase